MPREDIERYFDEAFTDLMDKAAVPGFRAGRAPRKLVESRFRKDIADQVKGSLLMDSMGQVCEDHDLSPISEPNFDPLAVKLPEEGPMTFEFDIEVRPEFDLPHWKGLKIERPVREFTEADIDMQLKRCWPARATWFPSKAPPSRATICRSISRSRTATRSCRATAKRSFAFGPSLSFRDGNIEKFDKLMKGVKAGETRDGQGQLTPSTAVEHGRRRKEVTAVFEVLEVKKLELPELTPQFLKRSGRLRERSTNFARRSSKASNGGWNITSQQSARKQFTAALTVAAELGASARIAQAAGAPRA